MMKPLLSLASLALLPAAAADEGFDHVAAIKGLRDSDANKGRELYALHCASCHGAGGDLALNPLARRFAEDEFKFGADPYSLWKTTSYGNGLMFRWDAVLSPMERYQIVHHIREDIVRANNPSQYSTPDDAYFAKLNARAAEDAQRQAADAQKVAVAPGMIDGSAGANMIYGPFMQHAVAYSDIKDINAQHIENTTESAMVIDLGDGTAICYDTARLSVSGIWEIGEGQKLADTTKTHHTSYKGSLPLRPSGEVIYQNIDDIGWRGGELVFEGHYLNGRQVGLAYSVGSRSVLEVPKAGVRWLKIGPGAQPLRVLVGRLAGGDAIVQASHGVLSDGEGLEGTTFITAMVDVAIDGASFTDDSDGGLWFEIPASGEALEFGLRYAVMDEYDPPEISGSTKLFPEVVRGGQRRWPQTVQTAVARGENVEGYALDVLTVPLANPYGSWMRLTALDFFSDGRIAVSTLSGDVWVVGWKKDNPDALTWSRFAAGLYEPLGLKIVDDKVYVRGRDRITRLHDLNGDGEADHYESFYSDENEIGASYHAFIYDLQTDRDGNFYFSQSGYKSPLTGGMVRIDKDGRYPEFIGTDLRNPNGLGAGGPRDWITIADNPSGNSIYNGFTIARPGAIYGYQKPRNLPMLVVLPARVDSSTSGQCWADAERWGPLGGVIVSGSFSRCAAFYCLVQEVGEFPNGFAVRLPWDLRAAPLRPRVSPADGQVYIAAQRGWDSIAKLDGAIYRIRHTGETSRWVCGAAATKTGIRLTFGADLDGASVVAENVSIVREGDKKGGALDAVPVRGVKLTEPRTVEVTIPGIEKEVLAKRTSVDPESGERRVKVNPAISVSVKFVAADGTLVEQTVYATINSLP